jgi:hypothetical protein
VNKIQNVLIVILTITVSILALKTNKVGTSSIDYDTLTFNLYAKDNILTTRPEFIEVYDTCWGEKKVLIPLSSVKNIQAHDDEKTLIYTYNSTYCIKGEYNKVKRGLTNER